ELQNFAPYDETRLARQIREHREDIEEALMIRNQNARLERREMLDTFELHCDSAEPEEREAPQSSELCDDAMTAERRNEHPEGREQNRDRNCEHGCDDVACPDSGMSRGFLGRLSGRRSRGDLRRHYISDSRKMLPRMRTNIRVAMVHRIRDGVE